MNHVDVVEKPMSITRPVYCVKQDSLLPSKDNVNNVLPVSSVRAWELVHVIPVEQDPNPIPIEQPVNSVHQAHSLVIMESVNLVLWVK